ncbi:CHAP domain-containing protein [Sinomonas albida]|uniref:CHAP domain-containing protein n=1 Tax=Sinomonas albida TaxID=369942 RepID=UPI001F3BC00F|nr:CHAP domain-containing protein [Sinomonas albida]
MAAPLMLLAAVVVLSPGDGAAQAAGCGGAAASPRISAPTQAAGFSGEQLANAAVLMDDAKKLGLPVAAQVLVVQAAIGESSLRGIGYTDAAGTVDGVAVTIGILQQDDSYGPRADRLDVAKAGTGFLSRLKDVPGWESLEPTIAIHRVQRNADPQHYAEYRGAALEVVQSLSGAKVSVGDCSGGGTAAGAGDDLPWGHGPVDAPSDLGMYTRECVDFALWRVNQAYGSTSAPFRFTNADFRRDGGVLGNAVTWLDGWRAKGWPVGTTPRAGAVVYYAPGVGGAGDVGHVAVVKAVNPDGSFLEEGYNGNLPPDDHTYYTRTVQDGTPTAFLYVPQKG